METSVFELSPEQGGSGKCPQRLLSTSACQTLGGRPGPAMQESYELRAECIQAPPAITASPQGEQTAYVEGSAAWMDVPCDDGDLAVRGGRERLL